jgi:hypothetical protein
VLPDYSHRNSPKTYTQPKLFASLVLKEFLRLDYRKLHGLLKDSPDLAATIELHKTPHFTTFQKAAARLLLGRHAQRYLDKTIRLAHVQRRLPRRVSLAALDGIGLETRHASSYYVKRRANTGKYWQRTTYRRSIGAFPKRAYCAMPRPTWCWRWCPNAGPAPTPSTFGGHLARHKGACRSRRLRPMPATTASTTIVSRATMACAR